MFYSEVQLTKLAQDDPKQLAKILINQNTNVNILTFGIEILAYEIQDETIFLEPVKVLLKHVNAIVREGACLATTSFYANKKAPAEVIERLRWLSEHDPSPAVKDCAMIALTDVFNV